MRSDHKFAKPAGEKRFCAGFGKSTSSALARISSMIEPVKTVVNYPKHARLFEEGRLPGGIFVVLQGRVKLFVSLKNGKTLILGIARRGEVLGLESAMLGAVSGFTAENLTPAQFSYVEINDFLRLLEKHREICMSIVEVLSHQLSEATDVIHFLSSSQSAVEKLAGLLSGWIARTAGDGKQGIELKLPLTRKEIGQMIGVTRETVSRLFAALEREGVLSMKGSRLRISSRQAMQDFLKSKGYRIATENVKTRPSGQSFSRAGKTELKAGGSSHWGAAAAKAMP